MKCPKCDYLGFETGDRCKNCGYDFSLLAMAEPAIADEALTLRSDFDEGAPADIWLNQLDEQLSPAHPVKLAPLADDVFDISLTPSAIEPVPPPVSDPVREPAPIELHELDAIDDIPEPVMEEAEAQPEPAVEAEPIIHLVREQAFEPLAPEIELALDQLAPEVDRLEPAIDEIEPTREPVIEPSPPAPRVTLHAVPPRPAAATAAEAAMPLFTPAEAVDAEDDEPLIKVPAVPRAPLAVRRTPDTPRLRAVPKLTRPEPDPEPALAFADEPLPIADEPAAVADGRLRSRVWRGPASNGEPGAPGRRVAAAAIDHLILFSIDLVVVYFTLRMAALDMGNWALLPQVPLATFLVVIKLAYFCAFTAIGGQTIGKMAARIRVVTEADGELEGSHAVRRTAAGAVSALTLGLGFLPGLVGQRRALHDRLAGTRVVGLEG